MNVDISYINQIGFLFVSTLSFMTIFLTRQFASLPLFIASCYMTLGQEVVMGGFHFHIIRIIIFFGWLRLLIRHELKPIKLNTIDILIIIYTFISIVNYVLIWGTYDAFKNRLGFAYNVIGIYFLFRFLIKDFEDIKRTIKFIGIIIIPLAGFMVLEKFTGRNIFSIFGGVPEFTMVRGEFLRCQGPFRHPIMAGTFGATTMPLIVGLLSYSENKKLFIKLSIIGTTLIVITSASSGPIMAYIFGLFGLLSWYMRKHLFLIKWGILFIFLFLDIFMEAPIWYLIARISDIIGGTGWHRSFLIEQALSHLNEWWLYGTKNTAHWMPYTLEAYPNSADITNQFISEGVTGGLVKMFLFISIIFVSFKKVGNSIRLKGSISNISQFQIWSFGVCLLTHIISFFSVSYFDQMILFWYMNLAFISTIKFQR